MIDRPPQDDLRGDAPDVATRTLWPGRGDDSLFDADDVGAFPQVDEQGDRDFAAFDPVFEIGAEYDETVPVLGSESESRIRQSVQLRGMDALGWYSPFHATGVQWGVYVPLSGIAYLMQTAFADLPASAATKARLAFHAILHHELFHFATEYAIAQAELSQRQA